MVISDDQITRLIYQSCLVLDAEDFDAYLDLFAAEFEYRVSNYSFELRKDQDWMDVNRPELKGLLDNVDQHSRLLGRFARQANIYGIDRNGADKADVTTFVTIYYTTPEGATSVFAVGKYLDLIDLSGDEPLIASREVRLETKELGIGTHLPL